jgi:hypothetical protein
MPHPIEVASLVPDISLILVVIACVVGAVRFTRLEPALRYLAFLLFFELFMEVASRILADQHRQNLFMMPIDTLVEFGLLALMYQQVFKNSSLSRWLPAVAGVFALASLLSYAEPATLVQFNTVQRFVESFLVLGLVLLYFYTLLRELAIARLEQEPMFWVSVGLLLYFSGNVFIFISSNYVIQHSRELSMKLWNIHALLYLVLNGLYAGALWISPVSRK